jgi:hypothetical protein
MFLCLAIMAFLLKLKLAEQYWLPDNIVNHCSCFECVVCQIFLAVVNMWVSAAGKKETPPLQNMGNSAQLSMTFIFVYLGNTTPGYWVIFTVGIVEP